MEGKEKGEKGQGVGGEPGYGKKMREGGRERLNLPHGHLKTLAALKHATLVATVVVAAALA